MALNPYAKPFVFKQAEPFRGDTGARPTGPLSSDETLHATNAKLERLRLAGRPVRGPEVDQNNTESTSVVDGKVLAPEALDLEELAFDDVFYQSTAEEPPALFHCRTEDEWPNGETGTAIDSGDPSKDADRTVIDTDLLHGSSGSSSLDGEIASAGFGRPGSDELGEGSPQGASLVQGDWSYSPTKLGPTDFELLRVVGQGAFGKVFQVRRKGTGQVYAMKVMRKERILARDHMDYVRAEREVLTAVFHPYIVTLRCSFQATSKLYLVLDFINGGHLFFQLYRHGIFDEDLARLYTAEMVLAIAHLHSLGIAHRDLKPENVLLDSEGHIKVTDFGLAKHGMNDEARTNSFIGTMEYMAPEIVAGKGHGKAVDWWSIGILLYEMLCGTPPFRAQGRQKLQKQILTSKLKLPPYLSNEAQSLLRGLLQKEAPKRLGYGTTGSEDVMHHPFFRSLSWAKLLDRDVSSPFRPKVGHVDSVENFDKLWTDMAPEDSPCNTPPATDLDTFQGFTYCAPSYMESMAAAAAMKSG
ncbi:g5877 [Coccomyxa viridis]|uniref:G5877 protein n=1 Tax=Coccomyxa viridis TaxID=1274662 RepID=A0ABP1FZ39_9CHLO